MLKNKGNFTDILKKELLELDSIEEENEHIRLKFKVFSTEDITLVTFDFKFGVLLEIKEMMEIALSFFDNSNEKLDIKNKSKIFLIEEKKKFEIIEVFITNEKKFLIEPKFEIKVTEDILKLRRKRKFELEDIQGVYK